MNVSISVDYCLAVCRLILFYFSMAISQYAPYITYKKTEEATKESRLVMSANLPVRRLIWTIYHAEKMYNKQCAGVFFVQGVEYMKTPPPPSPPPTTAAAAEC